MSDTAVTSRTPALSNGVAQSTALDSTSTAGTSVATGNTAVITPAGGGNTKQVVITAYGSGAATVIFKAGDEPPSENSALGDSDELTIASGKAYTFFLEAGRFVQDDGTVRVLVGGTGPVIFNSLTRVLNT